MFSNMGLHVIKFPSGRYGYVESLPTALATQVPATAAAVMGQRAFRNDAGAIVEWKFPVFETETEARAFAREKGFTVR